MPQTAAPLPTVTTTVSATIVSTPYSTVPPNVSTQSPTSIEAKIVILGAQGVGKTSLVNRFINPHTPLSTSAQSTIGASFVTKTVHDPDSNTTVRLQIWDTAGQERFRSISRLYYRGANAALLCYDVTSEKSWEEMKGWLREMRENCDLAATSNGSSATIVHIVGTKTDLVFGDPDTRQVPFEKTISYVADQLAGNLASSSSQSSTPPLSMRPTNATMAAVMNQQSESKRSSGFWNQDLGWDCCHEISAKDNDGIEEVFRVVARKLVEQRNKHDAWESAHTPAAWRGSEAGRRGSGGGDYFSTAGSAPGESVTGRFAAGGRENSTGSFRLGYGDKRRSWLGLPGMNTNPHADDVLDGSEVRYGTKDVEEARRRGRCC